MDEIEEFELHLKEKFPHVVEAVLAVDKKLVAQKKLEEFSAKSRQLLDWSLANYPLNQLKKWSRDNGTVGVLIRDNRGIRRDLTGTLVACDFHWNVVLKDVVETYYRPKCVRIFLHSSVTPVSIVPNGMRYEHVKKVSANLEVVNRRIPFLAVRGATGGLFCLIDW
uniref:Sm domain-containing protein n=1 Tax=Trichuris muris TaxID=70415 RepID=A0A5S6QPH7_TRIMR